MCGYSDVLQPFFYLLYDFQNNDFATGNKRKVIVANLPFHQTEGIATTNGLRYFVSNEKMTSPVANAQKLHTFDLTNFLGTYLSSIPTGISTNKKEAFSVYPNPATDVLYLKGITEGSYSVYNSIGQVMLTGNLQASGVPVQMLAPGIYSLTLQDKAGAVHVAQFIRK